MFFADARVKNYITAPPLFPAMRGKLIVIEGTDGSGKGTQFRKAVERLAQEGARFEQADFPQYGKPSAYFVEQYLTGKYGSAHDVSPRVTSLFYALDRYDSAPEMRRWLEQGIHIISNRYTTSNLGHQAGKAKDAAERKRIVKYIESLEYGELGVPKPDLVIFLRMHPFVAQQLIALKSGREYLNGGKRDIHETDRAHLEKAYESYLWVAKRDKSWAVVDCMRRVPKKKLLDPAVPPLEKVKGVEEIHELVWKEITRILK
jgi:dTMP kinase